MASAPEEERFLLLFLFLFTQEKCVLDVALPPTPKWE